MEDQRKITLILFKRIGVTEQHLRLFLIRVGKEAPEEIIAAHRGKPGNNRMVEETKAVFNNPYG
jgi:hypothetical protein